MKIAVVAIAYNRIDSLKRLISSLQSAEYDDENVTLIISIDKSDTDIVEKYADSITWIYGNKIVVKHKTNLGLRKHILSVGDYLNKYDAIIVLEDDITVAQDFYRYSRSAIEKYHTSENIAGISLYSYKHNPHNLGLFDPEPYANVDNYFIQWAPSWGQIWLKEQWFSFMEWYNNNDEEFEYANHLPLNICQWGTKSWLKYHTKYAIENNKFFVYPYIALSTCNGDAGVHTYYNTTINQVPLLLGKKKSYLFADLEDSIAYDAFFERIGIKIDNYSDILVDLNGIRKSDCGYRYWLTTQQLPYKIVKSYNISYRPIEKNISESNKGLGIYLYDTKEASKLPKYTDTSILYRYGIQNILLLIKDYKLHNLLYAVCKSVRKKMKI